MLDLQDYICISIYTLTLSIIMDIVSEYFFKNREHFSSTCILQTIKQFYANEFSENFPCKTTTWDSDDAFEPSDCLKIRVLLDMFKFNDLSSIPSDNIYRKNLKKIYDMTSTTLYNNVCVNTQLIEKQEDFTKTVDSSMCS